MKLNQDNLINLVLCKIIFLNQFKDLNSLFNEIKNIKDTPAAHKYFKFDLSSNLFGLTIEKAFGNFISD